MNVLYLSDSNTLSGAEVVLLQHLERFGPPQGQVHVFLSERNPRLKVALAERDIPFTTTTGYSERVLATTANPVALAHFAQSLLQTTRELRELIRKHRPALLHSVSYPAALYAALAARGEKVPHVWHEHNIKRQHPVNRRLYRFVAATCPFVIGPSDAVTSNLAKFGISPAKLRTVYNGIDLSRFDSDDDRARSVRRELGIEPDEFAIGLFGQMLPHKGHATLIAAAGLLKERGVSPRYLVVGALENPAYEAELRRLIETQGIADRFVFTGWRKDVHDVIRAADVSVVATTTPEPAALALMETMAMGRPVVATRTGGTAELVADRETGLLFPPSDAAALAEHLAWLGRHPAERVALGSAGRRRVEQRFSLARHLGEMESIYREAVARGGAGARARAAS